MSKDGMFSYDQMIYRIIGDMANAIIGLNLLDSYTQEFNLRLLLGFYLKANLPADVDAKWHEAFKNYVLSTPVTENSHHVV